MGLNLGFLGDVITGAATGFITSGGNPAGAFSGGIQGAEQSRAETRLENQRNAYNKSIKEGNNMAEIFGTGNVQQIQQPMLGSTANAGFGSGFGSFLGDVGRNIISPISGIASQVLPFFGRGEVQQPAVTTTRRIGAQENQQSGANEAFIGGIGLPGLIQAGRSLLRSPLGQIGTGTAIGGLVGSMTGTSQGGVRITRKMKSQARTVLNMTGGNIQATADILGIDQNTLIFILLKRFRNDGPVVTKAALRKTKQTVRRLKSMCDMYDDLRPRARSAVRRAPMRRSTTTLIKN